METRYLVSYRKAGSSRKSLRELTSVSLKTSVCLAIFNRPELTARVFEAVRRTRPAQLWIIADGPRTVDEKARCDETRAVVEKVDWDCEVQRNYSESNLGCRLRLASGLDWLFSHTSEAIILEDDCLPSPDFFRFAETLLDRYRDEERVMHIGGSNFLAGSRMAPCSYYFSKYAHIWGWATWARAWRHYDLEMKSWPDFVRSGSNHVFGDRRERKHWIHRLRPFATGERSDTWDYQWIYAVWTRQGLCVVPEVNLISNIGHGEGATHTRVGSQRANLAAGEMPTELHHPPELKINEEADRRMFYEALGGRRLLERQTWRYRLSKPARVWRKLWKRQQVGT